MPKDSELSVHVDAIVQIMEQRHGLDISAYEGYFLRQTIAKRLAESGLQTVEAYGECLAGSRAEAEALYRSLHVGYSEFFCDPLAFALLEQQILPALIAGKKHTGGGELRVWSAGCAAGQEAWSVAILLDALCGAGESSFAYRLRVMSSDSCG
jgi:chemotaxis protein methyltransferase CheR